MSVDSQECQSILDATVPTVHVTDGLRFQVPGTALMLLDFQGGTIGNLQRSDAAAVVGNARSLLRWAREGGVLVVFVALMFRPGYPEIPSHNKRLSGVRGSGGRLLAGGQDVAIPADLTPRPNEPVVAKRRVSAFADTDALAILRGADARRLVLAGIRTSGIVLSTLCQASDLDFELTVVEDACADPDAEVHRVLMRSVFPASAAVVKTADVVGSTLSRIAAQ